jgi:hypothetical protein
MKRLQGVAISIAILIVLGLVYSPEATWASSPRTQRFQQSSIDEAVKNAFQKAVEGNELQVMGFLIYDVVVDRIEYSTDGSVALLVLSFIDPLSGTAVATEPGLSIALSTDQANPSNSDNWQVKLQNQPDFSTLVAALPPELLSDDLKMRFLTEEGQAVEVQNSVQVFTGYKLPWAAGTEKRLTGSIGHVLTYKSCETTCRYAYDWADGTMFPLLASKGGIVKSFRFGCANNDHSCTNFVVLEDQSTIPTTYQVYYHMAYNTLPERLRVVGAQVLQGEYIGDVDNTGYSSGHHLHYHVFVTTTRSNWEWGYSVDFIYDDVAINGGHPRTCGEANQFPSYGTECNAGPDGKRGTSDDNRFMSANIPAHPPTGNLITPVNRQMITTQSITVGGTATDDIQVTRIQVLANWNETWRTIENITPGAGGVFAKEVDLCAANVPEGPFSLMVKIFDREGGQAIATPGTIQLIKNFSCGSVQVPPAPACSPNDNQVALYSEPDFRGACKKFDVREKVYGTTELGTMGDNSAASVQVGKNVQAVLFDLGDDVAVNVPEGRIETLEGDDANLADNRIGNQHVSGLLVQPRATLPDEPFLTIPGLWADGTRPTSQDSLVLTWNGAIGATSVDVILSGGSRTDTWTVTRGSSVSAGTLEPGEYNWLVTARNSVGTNSELGTFTVTSAPLAAAAARSLPFLDDVEGGVNGWTATGLWRRGAIETGGRGNTQAWIYNDGTNYAIPASPSTPWRGGDLTSPPLAVPSGAPTYLRFKYYADVEDGNPYWDQRLVQVVDDQGKVTELYQLSGDKQVPGQLWLQSPPLSLESFAGKTIRVRFHFDTVDSQYNNGQGWIVDDISVDGQAPAAGCQDGDKNSPDFAAAIAMDSTVTNAVICPQGDVDYYKFTGVAGQRISIDIDAQVKGSALDAQLFLIAADKQSVIAENDDEVLGDKTDSLLSYTLQRSGTYYIKVKAWDYPGAGGTNYTYDMSLKIVQVQIPRGITLLSPTDPKNIPIMPFSVEVTAEDFDGGPVAQVEYYWHGPDWVNGNWIKLGAGTKDNNRWYFIIHPALYGDVKGSALYVQAKNASGAALGRVLWDLEPDSITPNSRLEALPAELQSTAIRLAWTAEDPQNDITRFEIQYQQNSGSGWGGWTDWEYKPPAGARSAWFMGQLGISYNFRIRAVDASGNIEKYLDVPEASTRLAATCTPDNFESGNNSIDEAVVLPNWQSQTHNFCQGDVDWVKFDVPASSRIPIVMVTSNSGGAAFSVSVYNSARQNINTFNSVDLGTGIFQKLTGLSTGTYYLEIKPLRADLYGTGVSYQVYAGPARMINLSVISR